jgi:hypothetical protein
MLAGSGGLGTVVLGGCSWEGSWKVNTVLVLHESVRQERNECSSQR